MKLAVRKNHFGDQIVCTKSAIKAAPFYSIWSVFVYLNSSKKEKKNRNHVLEFFFATIF